MTHRIVDITKFIKFVKIQKYYLKSSLYHNKNNCFIIHIIFIKKTNRTFHYYYYTINEYLYEKIKFNMNQNIYVNKNIYTFMES